MLKLNLHCGDKLKPDYQNYDYRPEFITIPKVITSMDNYYFHDLEKGSVNEIMANLGAIESLYTGQFISTLQRWKDLLCEGGLLKIRSFDIEIICNNLCYHRITLDEFETAIIDKFRSIYTLNKVKQALIENGINLILVSYNGDTFLIDAEKK